MGALTTDQTIAVIGAGTMGAGIARSLRRPATRHCCSMPTRRLSDAALDRSMPG